MRASPLAAAAILMLAACGGTSSQVASHSPGTAAPSTAGVTPSIAPSSAPSESPSPGPPTLVHCSAGVPAGDNLVIGTVAGDPTLVVRDIQDPANAHNVCTFDPAAQAPQFISAGSVAYETANNQIIAADLAGGTTRVLAAYGAGFGSGQYSISPDGRSVSYLDGNTWRLTGPSGSKVLATLPAAPGRGVNQDEDDSFLRYSPDGQYVGLFQTFHTGGAGASAPDQVRRATDGSLVYSTSAMTMAVWVPAPSRLFFRDAAGMVHRWDPAGGLSDVAPIHWIRPRASPDGRWIAYTFRTAPGLGGVGFYNVSGNRVANTSPPGRSGAQFISDDLVWYIGEQTCSTCLGGLPTPTGVTYIYDIAGAAEVTARLTSVADLWPRYSGAG